MSYFWQPNIVPRPTKSTWTHAWLGINRSLRQPGASSRISSRFIVVIGNLKSLVTSINAENWSGLVTLRSSGLTVQDLLSKHVCRSNSQPPPSQHQCNLRVRNCLTLPHRSTLEYTLHTYSGVQVAITRRGVCLARNNTVRAALHPSVCLLVVPIMGAHCPLVTIGAPADTHSAPITIVTGVDTHCLCQPSIQPHLAYE